MTRWSYPFVCILQKLNITITWTYLKVLNLTNPCQVHSVECKSKIKSNFSILSHAIYGTVCIRLTYFPYYDCGNTCTLSYYQQIGMTHMLLFRVRSWNNSKRSMSLFYSHEIALKCFKSTKCCRHLCWPICSHSRWYQAFNIQLNGRETSE